MWNARQILAAFVLLTVSHLAAGQVSMSIQMNKPQKPVIGLPFSADQTVRLVQHLDNGMAITSEMKGHVYRAADGVERYDGGTVSSDSSHSDTATTIWLIDRGNHSATLLNTKLKTATVESLPATATVSINFLPLQQSRISGRTIRPTDLTTTSLGTHMQGMMTLTGKRVTGTIAAGTLGNDQPLYVTADVWFDPQLRLVVEEVEKDPLSGDRTFELTNIRGDEPDAALFQVPTGYTIKQKATISPMLGQQVHRVLTPQQIQDALSSPDPTLKNSVAYSLAQDNDHLAEAETLAEGAVKATEQETANVALRNDSDATYKQTLLLSSYWDTLGLVYHRQKKQEMAEKYARAAWDIKPNPEYALHLGSIYEAQNLPREAEKIYRMALSAKISPHLRDTFLARLAKLGNTDDQSLPMNVTTPLPSLHLTPSPEKAEILVQIIVAPNGLPVVTFLQGEPGAEESKSLKQAIQNALANTLPDSGLETILRRARVNCSATQTPACKLDFVTPENMHEASATVSLGQP
jgi:tetratricopeptide (TPR) repeat protein